MYRNSNTGRIHDDNCRARNITHDEHIQSIPKDRVMRNCKWCKATIDQTDLDEYLQAGYKICNDPKFKYVNQCWSCKSKKGTIMMYEHDGGVKVEGEDKKQWVFFLCECGYQTSYKKSLSGGY